MIRDSRDRANWPVVVAGGVVLVAAAVVAVRVVPELAPVRSLARDTEDFVVHAPERIQGLVENLRARFERARATFYTVRAEGERILTAQFEEAKQRGSIPPV